MACDDAQAEQGSSVKAATVDGHAVTTVVSNNVAKVEQPVDVAQVQLENQRLKKEIAELKAKAGDPLNAPLSEYLTKINHYTRIVRDAEVSKTFYTEILGCSILNRPNFGDPGYWLWMGNIQLHLIQDEHPEPCRKDAPVGKVNHISFECFDINKVEENLKSMNISYAKNLVPEGEYLLTQLFFPDPDGYYIEICTCDQMNDWVFAPIRPPADDKTFSQYNEGVDPTGVTLALLSGLAWSAEGPVESEKEFHSMLQSFKKSFDIVSNGKQEVSPEELSKLLMKMGHALEEKDLESLFEALDIDKSGKVSLRELLKILVQLSSSPCKSKEKLLEAFKAQDTDNSGSINLEEAQAVVWGMGINVDAGQLEARFKAMDKSGNGSVSFEEFAQDLTSVMETLNKDTV